jgi:inosine triphosphate pyrophosphatase
MKPVTFVTGNQNKVKYLEMYLGHPIKHVKLDLDEIQSLDPRVVVEHKVRQAYSLIGEPVLIEDTSLVFSALGKLPGPFIRFFVEEMSMEGICELLKGKGREAVASSTFGYFDGKEEHYFSGALKGTIAEHPRGSSGWDWDQIFVPEGYTITRAEMSEVEYERTALQIRPLAAVREFLRTQ